MKPLFTKEEFIDNVFKAAQQDKGDKISEFHAEFANKKVEGLVELLREAQKHLTHCDYCDVLRGRIDALLTPLSPSPNPRT